MDGLTLEQPFDEEVSETMRAHDIGREEAIYLVALRRGQVYGAGDLVSMQPLTLEQRRAIGLDHDPEHVIAESRARLAKKRSSDEANLVVDDADMPIVSSGNRRQ